MYSIRNTYTKIGTIQRRLAWPLRKSWGVIFSVPGGKGEKRGGKGEEKGEKRRKGAHALFICFSGVRADDCFLNFHWNSIWIWRTSRETLLFCFWPPSFCRLGNLSCCCLWLIAFWRLTPEFVWVLPFGCTIAKIPWSDRYFIYIWWYALNLVNINEDQNFCFRVLRQSDDDNEAKSTWLHHFGDILSTKMHKSTGISLHLCHRSWILPILMRTILFL